MRIKLIPGRRNERMISAIKKTQQTSTPEEWESFVLKCANDETLLDALYYASECGEDGLKDQEDYFTYLLLKKERNYFAARLGGVEL